MPMGMIDPEGSLGSPYLLRRTYADMVMAAGYAPIGIPTSLAFEDIKDIYTGAAGILMMGGHDIHPACYGENIEMAMAPFDPERDAFEIALVKQAAADKKPLIGICRGAQMIAVALGGSLHQDISALIGDEIHSPRTNRYEDILSKEDQLVGLESGCRLSRILGKSEAHGPCGHHQSIKSLPAELVVSGRSKAGIVEAIEAVDPDWYCFGVQSHPETRGGGDFKKLFAWKE